MHTFDPQKTNGGHTLSDGDRTFKKTSSSPDYSHVMGREVVSSGKGRWEVKVNHRNSNLRIGVALPDYDMSSFNYSSSKAIWCVPPRVVQRRSLAFPSPP